LTGVLSIPQRKGIAMKSRAKAGLAILGLSSAIAFAVPATAQDRGIYAGASIGQATAKDACVNLVGTGISCDDNDTSWKIFGGYQFTRNFAAELGYADFGEATASFGSLRETIEATAFEIVGVGMFPVVDRLSVFGKLGFYRGEVDDTSNFGFSASESNTDLTFGLGARYDFTRNLAVRAEWQRYTDLGGPSIGESDIDVISIGVLWKFF
jgi:OmpA-OmpF porin, OOP family